MSRKGKQPIALPAGVQVDVQEGLVTVKGPKGTLTQRIGQGVSLAREDGFLHLHLDPSFPDGSKFHGLYRALIQNMVVGTSKGFEKALELYGIGYRAAVQGNQLNLWLGFSNTTAGTRPGTKSESLPTTLPIPAGISVKVEKNVITIAGIDRQLIGQYCASVRALRPPSPYAGKDKNGRGFRYKGEFVRSKKPKKAAGKK